MSDRDRVERLDGCVSAMLAGDDPALSPGERDLLPLLRVAAHLLNLPRESFALQLRAELDARSGAGGAPGPARTAPQSLVPYLVVPDAGRLIAFLRDAFGAAEIMNVPRPGGGIQHAELAVGDARIEMADGTAEYPARRGALHLYVPDADAVYARALAAGGTSLYAPVDQPYGDREAGVTDPGGNAWFVATHRGSSHRPGALRSVTPYLIVRDAAGLVAFAERAFGAEVLDRHEAPEGVVAHAKLRIAGSTVELGEARGPFGPTSLMLHLYVADADAAWRRAVDAGARPISPVQDQPYGERNGGVEDGFGNQWYVASLL
jgi:PhnB protein